MKVKNIGKIKQNDKILALKVKTESNGLGVLKTIIILFLIVLQIIGLALTYLYFLSAFKWYFVFSVFCSLMCCVHVLSSDYHGQAKATWVLFLLTCFSFGYIMYILSDKRVLFGRSRKKMNRIEQTTKNVTLQPCLNNLKNEAVRGGCNYLYNAGGFVSSLSSKTEYFSSGASFFDDILFEIKKAKEFIFVEFFIISNGVLLNRFFDVLKQKAKEGVEIRIIYDDMGSHRSLKRKTKKEIVKSGIKLQAFNRLVPIFNIALNLRDHRKIVVIDGVVSYTGGANLADEYINEKRIHGYWKDSGIKIYGEAVNNFTIAFLKQWMFLTKQDEKVDNFVNFNNSGYDSSGVVVPFVSGPNYRCSIAHDMVINAITSADKFLYIVTPYFIPDETIVKLIIAKAKCGVDIKLVIPDVADKKFVYIVSRNNAEKLIQHGVKIYVMNHSFVHSKLIINENFAIISSINMDQRSFNQQFESAVFTSEVQAMASVLKDIDYMTNHGVIIDERNMKRRNLAIRIMAGVSNLISPFM